MKSIFGPYAPTPATGPNPAMVALSQALARSGSTVQDAETLQKLAQDVRSSDGYTKSPEDRASIEKCIHWGAKALLSPVGPSAIEVQQRKAQHKAMKAHLQTLLGPVPSTSDAPPDQQEGPLVGSGMGALALAEKPRPESPHTIAELRARGCTVEPVEWRVVCPKAADTNVRIVVQEASTNAVVWKYFEVPLTILRGFLERALKPKGMLEDQNREVVLHAPCLDVGSLTPIMEALADRSCTQLPDAPSALLKIYEAIHFLLLEEERGVRRLAVTCEQRIVESVESNHALDVFCKLAELNLMYTFKAKNVGDIVRLAMRKPDFWERTKTLSPICLKALLDQDALTAPEDNLVKMVEQWAEPYTNAEHTLQEVLDEFGLAESLRPELMGDSTLNRWLKSGLVSPTRLVDAMQKRFDFPPFGPRQRHVLRMGDTINQSSFKIDIVTWIPKARSYDVQQVRHPFQRNFRTSYALTLSVQRAGEHDPRVTLTARISKDSSVFDVEPKLQLVLAKGGLRPFTTTTWGSFRYTASVDLDARPLEPIWPGVALSPSYASETGSVVHIVGWLKP